MGLKQSPKSPPKTVSTRSPTSVNQHHSRDFNWALLIDTTEDLTDSADGEISPQSCRSPSGILATQMRRRWVRCRRYWGWRDMSCLHHQPCPSSISVILLLLPYHSVKLLVGWDLGPELCGSLWDHIFCLLTSSFPKVQNLAWMWGVDGFRELVIGGEDFYIKLVDLTSAQVSSDWVVSIKLRVGSFSGSKEVSVLGSEVTHPTIAKSNDQWMWQRKYENSGKGRL